MEGVADCFGEVGDDPAEEAAAKGGGGAGGGAGDAVGAGAVNGVREDEAGGAVGVVRGGEEGRAGEGRVKGEHEGGLGLIGVPVGGVGEKSFFHAGAGFGGVEDGNHEAVVAAAEDFESAAERGGIGDVTVDEKEAAESGAEKPVAEVGDEGDERLGLEGEGAGPAMGVPDGAAVGERRQHGHAGRGGDGGADVGGERGVHAGAEVRAVLLGGAAGKHHGVHAGGRKRGDLGPGEVAPENGGFRFLGGWHERSGG